MQAAPRPGDTLLTCELTVRNGRIVYDFNAISMDVWNQSPSSDNKIAAHWMTMPSHTLLPEQITPVQK